MPTHKITNEFIRKYNKTFAIKGYSKLPISEKIALVRKHVDKVGGAMKTEWDGIMSSTKTKVPKGSHKMPDGSIMKDSAMKKKRQLSSAPNLVKGLEKKKAPKPVYKLKSPRPVGAVARPNRTKRPGSPHSGALGGLTEPKFKSTPKYTLAKKGPSAITMTSKPPSSTMKIVKRTPTKVRVKRTPTRVPAKPKQTPFSSVNRPLDITKSPKIKKAIKEFLLDGRNSTATIKLPSIPLQEHTKKALISIGWHRGGEEMENVIKKYNTLPQNMKENLGLLLYGYEKELHTKYSNLKSDSGSSGGEYYRFYNPGDPNAQQYKIGSNFVFKKPGAVLTGAAARFNPNAKTPETNADAPRPGTAPGDPTGIRVKRAKALDKFQRDLDAADVRLYDMPGGEITYLTDNSKREIEKHDNNGMGFFTNAHTNQHSGGDQYYGKIQMGKRPVSNVRGANQKRAIAVLKKQPAFLRDMFSFVFYYGTDDDLQIVHYDDF